MDIVLRAFTLVRLVAAASLALCALRSGARADPVKIYAAGSLTGAMKELIAQSGLPASAFAEPVFGPAGLLRERIEKGERADLFLSANLDHPRRLVEIGRASMMAPFVRNQLCVVAEKSLGITSANMLEKLLDPKVRLATSTPVADPGGDYAWAMFQRADVVKPGARATLEAKAIKLIGSPNAMAPVGGRSVASSIFLAGKADALIYYCSGVADVVRDQPGLASYRLPQALDVPVFYGFALMSDQTDAMRFGLFVLSDKGQAILARSGLIPLSAP